LGYDALDLDIAHRLTEITSSGKNGRGPSRLCRDELWAIAARLLGDAGKVAVISGFYVPSASSAETDGPTGSLVLARALSRAGKDVRVWTDAFCLGAFKSCAKALGFPENLVEDATAPGFDSGRADLVVYVERLGRARDGAYYDMRGYDITRWTAPLDSFASSCAASIGIGDGGNEVGMGNYLGELSGLMPGYSTCLCAVKTDVCLPVDVSNWGAYALASAMSALHGEWLGQSAMEESSMLRALAGAGAVDGITKKNEVSVDGMPLEKQLEVVALLTKAVGMQSGL
jgi:hypothetical protein